VHDLRHAIGSEIRRLRLDAGLSQRRLATAAGIDQAHLSRIERGQADVSVTSFVALADALGGDARLRIYPGTGPRLRDHLQARMIDTLVRILDPRWRCSLEVPVHRPSRGVIDLVLDDQASDAIVSGEAESDLRRFEAQTRWANAKAESLPSSELWQFAAAREDRRPSRLLLLRSTSRTRTIVREHAGLLSASYPARSQDAYRALTTPTGLWPGASILWVRLEGSATVLAAPPRGVPLGR
jgi:transcriptional regulator with XRE-family HTH domain